MTARLLGCFLTAALGLTGCSYLQGSKVEVQKQAIFQCKNQFGIGGQSRLETNRQGWGQAKVTIVPYDPVTPSAAAWINDCADRALGADAALSESAVSARPARSVVQGGGYCQPGQRGLYRGTTYCF